MYIFEISIKKRIFYTPFNLFKEKVFISQVLEESMCTLYKLESPKCKQPLNIS